MEKAPSESFASDDSSIQLPSDDVIRKTIKTLSKTVDFHDVSVKQLVAMIADKTDCDPDDLYSVKKSFVKKRKVIETKLQQQAHAEAATEPGVECAPPLLPDDDEIIRAAQELAHSPHVDLSSITRTHFLKRLSKKMRVDLSPKKQVVFKALQGCKEESEQIHSTTRSEDDSPTAFAIPSPGSTSSGRNLNHAKVMEILPGDNNPKTIPVVANPGASSFHRTEGKYHSVDLEQGRRIPQAAELSWEDPFFVDESEDLVAVFDHDYEAMFRYHMKVLMYTCILPIFVPLMVVLMAILLVPKSAAACEADPFCDEPSGTEFALSKLMIVAVIFVAIILFGMYLYGKYRLLKSQIYSYHLAIARDGIKAVQDDHLEGRAFRAAIHCFDTCLLVTRQDEVIPFDQITKVTIKNKGERDDAVGFGWCCCAACLTIPYDRLGIDTGSSNPAYFEACIRGLTNPHECHKLIWAMKREKGEQIHLDNRDANLANLETNRMTTALLQQLVLNSSSPGNTSTSGPTGRRNTTTGATRTPPQSNATPSSRNSNAW